jgi:hypothetical protein
MNTMSSPATVRASNYETAWFIALRHGVLDGFDLEGALRH